MISVRHHIVFLCHYDKLLFPESAVLSINSISNINAKNDFIVQ